MTPQQMIADLETRAARLLQCAAAVKAAYCPLCTGAVPPPTPQPKPARREVKGDNATPTAKATAKPSRVTAEKVLAAVAEAKGLTATEAGVKLGCSMESAWYHLNRLAKAGTLTVGADKKYRRAIAAPKNDGGHA